jgi:hypothetical protein
MLIWVTIVEVRGTLDEWLEGNVGSEDCGGFGAEVMFAEAIHVAVVAEEDRIEGCVCIIGLDSGWLG